MRKSPGSPSSRGASPASITKPTLAGRSGSSSRRPANSMARRSVSSPATQSGATSKFRRPSRRASASSRPSSPKASSSAGQAASGTPRTCRLARLVRSTRPAPCLRAAAQMPRIWSRVKRASRGRSRSTRPSPDIIGRSAPGHQPCTRGAAIVPTRAPASAIALSVIFSLPSSEAARLQRRIVTPPEAVPELSARLRTGACRQPCCP